MKRRMLLTAAALLVSALIIGQDPGKGQKGTKKVAETELQEQKQDQNKGQIVKQEKQARNEARKAAKKQQKELKRQEKELKKQEMELKKQEAERQKETGKK